MSFGSHSTIAVAVVLLLFARVAPAQNAQQKTFPTAPAAVNALVEAARSNDVSALQDIFGPDGKELVSSGDDIADKNARANFVKAYEQQHKLTPQGTGKFVLTVGTSGWPLPIPIIRKGEGWVFDSAAGKEEVLYRRVGRNELETIQVCHAIIEAQREYARRGHDGNPPGSYARRIRSEPGKENGLYWEPKEGEPISPAGPLLAEAAEGGYEKAVSRRVPFHGYLYRILTAQGPNALGGAKDYLVDGNLTGGVAVVAYPAEYRSSGVMTFIVNQRGIVYQKDLGTDTEEKAKAMTAFDPDPSWKRAD